MKKARRDHLISVADDGLPAERVGAWAERKYRVLRAYSEIFSTGMKNAWPTRVYIDLFAGSGHAVLGDSRRRVLSSPLIALSIPDPFTKYVFCENDPTKFQTLRARVRATWPNASVTCIKGDANARAEGIAAEIPPHSKSQRVLSFCFIDPYNLEIDFETVKTLGAERALDFIIVLMLQMDAGRNWTTYVREDSDRIDKLLGSRDWRHRWHDAQKDRVRATHFLAVEYAHAMTRLGYRPTSIEQMIPVRSTPNNLLLYYLAFFSKNEKGYTFWREVQKYSTDQMEFPLG